MRVTKKIVSAAVLMAAVSLTACGGGDSKQAAASSGASNDGKNYVVAFDAAYAPFEFQDDKGNVVGFSKDVIAAVAADQNLNFTYQNQPWEGIFAKLNQGDADIVSSSVTITDERKKAMDFSEPYFEATQMIVVGEKGNDIKSFNDLKNRMVSVQNGTTGDLVMQKLQGQESKNIKRFESMPLALKELQAGGVEASVGDNGVIQNFVTNNASSKFRTIVDPSFETEYYGFAFKPGRTDDLQAKVNAGLANIQASGEYQVIFDKWFAAPAASDDVVKEAPKEASAQASE